MLGKYLLTTISDSYPQGAIRKNLFGGIAPFLSFENLCRRIS